MNYKVEYITRLFQKTSSKAIENYCLTRLWHRLDNDEIKFVPQQYVNRHTDKYALTDVYLLQFKIHIEVNEPAHYTSPHFS
ncbi:AbaSI family restriction endonuclease [Eisenibacter elegans]|uniref:AbaSI family restriction endonuclease n=1 Tax=Eisenibacter elegans TaxID=997 RepID=UPI00047EFCE8